MDAEIVAVGTELLMGETQDTHSFYLANRLPPLGLELRSVAVVGDTLTHVVEALDRARRRSPYVFTTGGLGPTVDDLTREAIAQTLGEELSVDDRLLGDLTALFQRRGNTMPPHNIKQAWLIPSAQGIPNVLGTAPGWWVERDGSVIVALPGPPRELQDMWEREVAPRLRQRVRGSVILTRTLKTLGLGEATLDEMIASELGTENPYVGIYTRPDGISVRVIARATTQEEAEGLLSPVEERLRSLLGPAVWGADQETAAEAVGALLHQRGETLATMESCTGGLLANAITEVPGSSDYFNGGIVSYTNELKIASGVDPGLIERFGSVSQEVAEAMAESARQGLGAHYGIGITGVAGPEELEGHAPGTVCIGITGLGHGEARLQRFPGGNRSLVKQRAVTSALLSLHRLLVGVQ